MRIALKIICIIVTAGIFSPIIPTAQAFFTPHPLKYYEQGLSFLKAYQGDKEFIQEAHTLFSNIIQKHPDSPFGYLGMSQLKTLEAYRYGQHYNVKLIIEQAMPMAIKAMRYGPTIDGVHANYDRFEKILKSNDTNQDFVSRALEQFPEKAETYHILAEYLTDQGDYQKALEYYQIALRFANDNFDKLISLQRIAQIYSKNLGNNKLAIENWQAALAINANLPTVWEDLGSAYFEQEQYDLSVQNLQKAWDFFNTAQLRRRLLAAQNLAAKFHDKPQAQSKILSSLPRDNKQNTSLHLEIANLYYEKNDFKNAYDHYQQAIEGGILNPEIYYFAGRCAHSLGLVDVAKNYYVQYLKLNRDGQKAQWIRENVPELSHL